ncbi:MAG TPA: alpha/beta hydrolase [Candidatus Acidoferrum sp.]|nr:alpha/beta hydrolase [Candidatus Acidoferrum sp.]
MFERLADLVNADERLVSRGRFLTTTFLLEAGDDAWLIRVVEGRIERVERGPFVMRAWSFAIRAPAESWRRFWELVPAPGYHDLFAMSRNGHARIEGDLVPLMTHLRYVQDVLSAPRRKEAANDGNAEPSSARGDAAATIEPIVGRYVRLTFAGRPHRIYFEEAGRGIPLVCLHTAGADGRQYRHLLNDEAITSHYRVIAFDMPWHGKSLPPPGWQRDEYRLTMRGYTDLILAVCRALSLDRPVVLGCSIGGKIVLNLALEHPDEFSALIGVESADYQPPWYDDTTWLHRPDIHGGEIAGAMMSGLIAPQSPEETRWDTLWGYMQGGPGVFKGDLYFYRVDGDMRDRVARIDTKRCPLYLLTGEYDFSCQPDDTLRTAAKIPGARVTIMKEIGHFPMSENPAQFRGYIVPVLDEIRSAR